MEGYPAQNAVCKPPAHSFYSREPQPHSLLLPPRCLPALPSSCPVTFQARATHGCRIYCKLFPRCSHAQCRNSLTLDACIGRSGCTNPVGTGTFLQGCFQCTLTKTGHILPGSRPLPARLEPVPFLPLKEEVLYPLSHNL